MPKAPKVDDEEETPGVDCFGRPAGDYSVREPSAKVQAAAAKKATAADG